MDCHYSHQVLGRRDGVNQRNRKESRWLFKLSIPRVQAILGNGQKRAYSGPQTPGGGAGDCHPGWISMAQHVQRANPVPEYARRSSTHAQPQIFGVPSERGMKGCRLFAQEPRLPWDNHRNDRCNG